MEIANCLVPLLQALPTSFCSIIIIFFSVSEKPSERKELGLEMRFDSRLCSSTSHINVMYEKSIC